MVNKFQHSLAILIKLGSIAVHTKEMLSKEGHEYDIQAIKTLLVDPEIIDWIKAMDKMALLPKERNQDNAKA